MTRNLVFGVVVLGMALMGCGQSSESLDNAGNQPGVQSQGQPPAGNAAAARPGYASGTVKETMDTGGYTYVQVETSQGLVWAAAPQFSIEVGADVSFATAMPMKDYHSSTLDRTFDVVYFTQAIELNDGHAHAEGEGHAAAEGDAGHARNTPEPVAMEAMDPVDGGLTVEQVFAQKSSLGGRQVTLRGKVVKFNAGIMGKNWFHLQDGTGMIGANDLTVTTQETVTVGSTITVTGTIVLDQDFGAGYAYDVLMEGATVSQ